MSNPTALPFAVVDVFSPTAFKGNPLAVVNTLGLPTPLTKPQQQLIARQFNLSETTFFAPPSSPDAKAHYSLRSFLPDGREVFGAGHNILGVWWYLAASGLLDLKSDKQLVAGKKGEYEFWQELGGAILPVKILSQGNELRVSIRQAPPKSHASHPDLRALAQSIGLQASDIGFDRTATPLIPQVVSTATTKHLHVPIASIEALNRVSVQREKLLEQLALVDSHAYGLYLVARIPGEKNAYQARFFSPGMSGEDPATGSAAGPLALYLYEQGLLELSNEGVGRISVLQGLRVGRKCLITVTLTQGADGGLEVDFEGGGVEVMKGEILPPGVDLEF